MYLDFLLEKGYRFRGVISGKSKEVIEEKLQIKFDEHSVQK